MHIKRVTKSFQKDHKNTLQFQTINMKEKRIKQIEMKRSRHTHTQYYKNTQTLFYDNEKHTRRL